VCLSACVLGGCGGPRARVDDIEVGASPVAGRVRVQARVVNRSRGQGQVALEIRLRERHSGRLVAAERKLSLEGHDQARLVADIEAPPGDYAAEIDAKYPPE
jgi:hypothetical protein